MWIAIFCFNPPQVLGDFTAILFTVSCFTAPTELVSLDFRVLPSEILRRRAQLLDILWHCSFISSPWPLVLPLHWWKVAKVKGDLGAKDQQTPAWTLPTWTFLGPGSLNADAPLPSHTCSCGLVPSVVPHSSHSACLWLWPPDTFSKSGFGLHFAGDRSTCTLSSITSS